MTEDETFTEYIRTTHNPNCDSVCKNTIKNRDV